MREVPRDEIIQLSEEKLDDIQYGDVIALTIAESGAMGEPDAFYLVDKDLRIYYTNLRDFNFIKLANKITMLRTLNIFLGNAENVENGWKNFYMGFGNYLFVKNEYSERIQNFLDNECDKKNRCGELYCHWYSALKTGA
ncbi:hypothetical protein IK110_03320 [Candidatus Saccharibacteria bacterium]|nr:hypothetical protein [Candidatus Saccharibacteria bacterium]